MNIHPLTFVLLLSVLLISCGEKKSTTPAAENETPSMPTSKPTVAAPQTKPPAAKPAVNVAKLNEDLMAAISFNQPDKAIAAIQAGATPDAKKRHWRDGSRRSSDDHQSG